MYAVTLYEKGSRYYPEEGGFHVESLAINNQTKFASLNEAKADLGATKAWFEEEGWTVTPIRDGWDARDSHWHIGEGWIVRLEVGEDVGGLVSTPGDYE